jgi:hypothetical protein
MGTTVVNHSTEMEQTTNPTTLVLTGMLPFLLLVSAALSFPISLGLIHLYERAVRRSMRADARSSAVPPPLEAVIPPPLPETRQEALQILDATSGVTGSDAAEELSYETWRAPWRTAIIHGAGGLGYAVTMTVAWLIAGDMEFLPMRFLMLLGMFAWPVVLTINLTAASNRRAKILSVTAYFLIVALPCGIGLAKSPESTVGQLALLWVLVNMPATVLLLASLHRRIRAVGPLVLAFITFAVTGSLVGVAFLGSNELLLRPVSEMLFSFGLNAHAAFAVMNLAGLILFAPLGWLAVQWVRSRYERKKISDQSLAVDAIWLLFGVVQPIGLAFEHVAWILSGLGGFIVYKTITSLGFRLMRSSQPPAEPGHRLLLLRVFSLGKRSERLFDALGKHWRHIGSIQMIAGPDLATTTVEPHEFLDFLRGRLARRFIDSAQSLELRLSELDLKRDGDRRFRVNEFFCRDPMWKTVLSSLVGKSDVVLMDLRGFSPQNAGCIFEINHLIHVMPPDRVVFVVDKTSDEPFLRETLQHAWNQMPADQPQRPGASTGLRLFRLTGQANRQFRQLLQVLCTATGSPLLAGHSGSS